MATNGKITKKIRNDINIYISWNAVQNVTGNYSTVTATLYINRQYSMYSSGTGKITLNGATKSGSYNISTSSGGTYRVATIEKKINHSSDGKGSFKLGGSVDFRGTTLSGTTLYEVTIPTKTITLNDIKRLTVASAGNFTVDKGTTVSITRYLSGSTNVSIFANNTFIKGYTGVGSSVDVSFDEDEIDKILKATPDSHYSNIKIRVNTYNSSGTYLGATYKTVKGYLPSTAQPLLGTIYVKDTNPKNPKPDTLLQYVSLWELRVDDKTPGAYASIKELKWELINSSGSTFYTATGDKIVTPGFSQHGTVTVKATLTDSRGRTATKSTNTYLSYYRSPTISAASAIRVDGDGQVTPSGTNVLVNATIKGATVSGENPIEVYLYKKLSSESKYDETPYYQTELRSLTWYESYAFEKQQWGLDIATSYDIKLVISDNYASTEWEGQIPVAYIPMAFSSSGVGIGAFPRADEDSRLQIFGDASFETVLKKLGGAEPIKAVLKNGWTGYIYYQKDGFGNAHIWGEVTPGKFKKWAIVCALGSEWGVADVSMIPLPSVNSNLNKGSRTGLNLYLSTAGTVALINTTDAYSDDTFIFSVSYHLEGGW